jgi:surface polysaccharide O-acyltransferase-like enzyme
MVVTYHTLTEPYNAALFNPTQTFGLWWSQTIYQSLILMGVPLFVMLSGALLLQPSKVDEPIRVFFKKRLSRIGIAFVFWSIIYFAWSYFINNQVFTVSYVIQTFLNGGAYYQFWFIYLIMGMYLVTPVMRAVVAYADRKILRYLIILWFISASLVPLFNLITGFSVDGYLFVFGGFLGYFILGAYLMGVQVKTKILKLLLAGGIIWTILGLFVMSFVFHSVGQFYFFSFTTSVNIVIASVALYMLLSKAPRDWPGNKHPRFKWLIQTISANTLPIFFLHVIVIETLNKGLLGFSISLNHITPAIEIPLGAAATLFICLGLILLMKKVPVLRTLIG